MRARRCTTLAWCRRKVITDQGSCGNVCHGWSEVLLGLKFPISMPRGQWSSRPMSWVPPASSTRMGGSSQSAEWHRRLSRQHDHFSYLFHGCQTYLLYALGYP